MTNFNKMTDDALSRKMESGIKNEAPKALPISTETVPAELHMSRMDLELSASEKINLMQISGGKEQKS